ncbi:hypothetical protein B0H65DRAFT_189977 [Neurospora tetraspora]|uniref:Uncharacterized protein n=1 Tax=Neurospora tetraspora TaxID=94610 RepID=A0AAE0JEZ4_9PEZI|nr:hypothetical protein B0H65DRAFT_189977 [Neurospora tetraspora]
MEHDGGVGDTACTQKRSSPALSTRPARFCLQAALHDNQPNLFLNVSFFFFFSPSACLVPVSVPLLCFSRTHSVPDTKHCSGAPPQISVALRTRDLLVAIHLFRSSCHLFLHNRVLHLVVSIPDPQIQPRHISILCHPAIASEHTNTRHPGTKPSKERNPVLAQLPGCLRDRHAQLTLRIISPYFPPLLLASPASLERGVSDVPVLTHHLTTPS